MSQFKVTTNHLESSSAKSIYPICLGTAKWQTRWDPFQAKIDSCVGERSVLVLLRTLKYLHMITERSCFFIMQSA